MLSPPSQTTASAGELGAEIVAVLNRQSHAEAADESRQEQSERRLEVTKEMEAQDAGDPPGLGSIGCRFGPLGNSGGGRRLVRLESLAHAHDVVDLVAESAIEADGRLV